MQILSETEPSSYTQASKDQKWIEAMETELKALNDSHTWEITTLPPGKNPIGCKWVCRI